MLTGAENDGHFVRSRSRTASLHHWPVAAVVDTEGDAVGEEELKSSKLVKCGMWLWIATCRGCGEAEAGVSFSGVINGVSTGAFLVPAVTLSISTTTV